MKIRSVILAIFLSSATGLVSMAKEKAAGSLEGLDEKIQSDLASGAISKPAADELEREVARIKKIHEEYGGKLTGKTRHDLQQDVQKVKRDLALKEQEQKANSKPAQ